MDNPYPPSHVTQHEVLSGEAEQFNAALKNKELSLIVEDINNEAVELTNTLVHMDDLSEQAIHIMRGKIRGLRSLQVKIDAVREAFQTQLTKHDHV